MVKDCKKEKTGQSQSYPQFFKVYLPERSSQRLIIPSAFVAHLNKVMPEKTILRSRRGRLWHVEVNKTEDGVCFQNGWQSFVRNNSLELGEILIFKYNGDNIFDVKIFGKSGCEKEEMGSYVGIDSHIKEENEKVEEEEEEEEEKDDDDDDDDTDGDNNDDDDNEDDYLENDDDDDDDDDDNEDDEKEEFEEEEELKAKTFKVKMPGCKTKSCGRSRKKFGGHKGTSAVKGKGADEGAATVNHEEENVIKVERYVQPKNPYFLARLRTGKTSNLHVPVDVLRYPNLQLYPKVILYDPDGRKWLGNVTIWQDGRTWIGGWKSFCRSNNVGENDSCICEFLEDGGQWGNVIQVHIVRAEVQTTNI